MEWNIPTSYCRLMLPEGIAELTYRVLTNGEEGAQLYSLYVTLEFDGDLDSEFVYGVTCSREEMLSLLNLLARNTVTPCTLYEILSEIL